MCTTIYSFLSVVRAWPSCLLLGLRCGYVWTIFHKVPLFNTTRASILSLPCSLVSKHDIFYCHGHTLSTNLAYHPLRSFYELHYFLFVIEGGGGSFIFFIVIFIILMFTWGAWGWACLNLLLSLHLFVLITCESCDFAGWSSFFFLDISNAIILPMTSAGVIVL